MTIALHFDDVVYILAAAEFVHAGRPALPCPVRNYVVPFGLAEFRRQGIQNVEHSFLSRLKYGSSVDVVITIITTVSQLTTHPTWVILSVI